MKKKSEKDALNERIVLLHAKQALELKLLREQFHITLESFKPVNLIKSTFHEVTSSTGIKNNILDNMIGLTTGYLSKKVLFGSTHNPVKNIFGALLQFAIANVVSKHPGKIKSAGENIFKRILQFKNKSKQEFLHNGNS